MKKVIDDLINRKILKDISNIEKLNKITTNHAIYAGFDPTAKSLHLGNFIHIINLMRFQKQGYRAIALVGGITGMIGDPSFRDSERKFLDSDTLLDNKNHIIAQLKSFGLEVIDNLDFYKNMHLADFLKLVGTKININYMLAKDSVKQRLANGMTFTEFSYQLIQGWDFKYLYENQNVCVQMGGSDQWGNITTGLELIKNFHGENHLAVAITSNLLTDSNGNKIGKSSGGGNLWLDKNLTSPYSIYQYLLNQSDSDVEKLLNWLTFLEPLKINDIYKKHLENPKLREAQKILAYETVSIIHGIEVAKQCQIISDKLFKNNILDLTLNDIKMLEGFLKTYTYNNQNFIDFIVENKILNSKREFREFLNNGALALDSQKITDENLTISFNHFDNKYAILRKGKKEFIIIKK
ncbi:tyrosine--tRNA ligase [Mycoplasma miroungirhinis]|uniref:Tyrosine--tRNA ligase n=1 Tax=Mycoplasma miroungirhinis TaxID=754516 RepID=A0A6M4JB13_9MOLU|nr:tyrosine--tRNA ligase [Mycoplasma miroungirhinis]QJR44100.1 tyrosine--tRNA ligase [Mycoplasma miroungirhinis]